MDTKKNNKIRYYKTYLRPTLLVLGLSFLIFITLRNWQETQVIFKELNWSIFVFSVLFAVADNLIFSVYFHTALRKYGINVSYLKSGQMYFFGQMAKYIPGRFWNIFFHTTFENKQNSTIAILVANVDLMSFVLFRNLVFAITLFLLIWNAWLMVPSLILGSLLLAFLVKSCWLIETINFFAKIFRYHELRFSCNQKCFSNILIFTVIAATWLFFMLANFLVMKSTFNLDWNISSLYIAYFSIAWIVGAIAFIFPAGFGVRELTFILLAQMFGQQQSLSIELLTAIAIVYRFWQVCHEVGGVFVGLVFNRLLRLFSTVANER